MTTIFQEKNKKQGPLLIVFFILLIVTVVLLLGNDQDKKEIVSPTIRPLAQEINIDFNFLEMLEDLGFTDFSPIEEYEQEIGRSNAFLPSDLVEDEPVEDEPVEEIEEE